MSDADFICYLRNDPQRSRFLSLSSGEVADQKAWLEEYLRDSNQVYFIIEDLLGSQFGTVRLYDPRGESFCWGSWILLPERPSGFAYESALMVYAFARECGFTQSHFDVRKGNESVWRFHERWGARRVGETELDYLYEMRAQAIDECLLKFKRILPDGISIDWG